MSAAMPRVIEPTDQMLRDACARMAQRFRWTEPYDAVMQDPVRSRLVRITAKHDAAASAPPQRPRGRGEPLRGFPLIDHKRAAAGERDDD